MPYDVSAHLHPVGTNTYELRGLTDLELVIIYFADRKGRPLPPGKRKGSAGLSSEFVVLSDAATFRADGTVGGNDMLFGGAIGGRTVVDLLPSDYVPQRK